MTETCAELGESPVWRTEDDMIWWVDVEGLRLLRTDARGRTRAWFTPEAPGFVQLDAAGAPLVGMGTGLHRFDEATGAFARLAAMDAPGRRCNDACVDAAGRLWFGTMDVDNLRANGALYVMGADAVPHLVQDAFRTLNGLAWDAARERLFVSDSHARAQTLWTLRLRDDRPPLREVFARFDALPGRPDGAAMDADGHCWIAGVGGAELLRFAPDGRIVARVPTPMAQPTKPAFIGPGLGRMVLTSRRGPGGGGRLAAWDAARAMGVRGVPAPRWRGPAAADANTEDKNKRQEERPA
ncbi:MAG: hypothetical protein CML46_04500 [Rhodobacteraceae bacterium]|nr:hypothetical protein [Paracoccaceae bacterium]MBR26197.1 hypothetical protein [Paracoccaceae bacterium]